MMNKIVKPSSTTNVASVTSLATALRDRRAYAIPMQPNRSLPVRPAPHHTPSRTGIVRCTLERRTSGLTVDVIPSENVVQEATNVDKRNANEVGKNKTNTRTKDTTMMRVNGTTENCVTTSENFIDISRSPERIDLTGETIICPSRLDSTSSGCWVHDSIVTGEKRKRRRRTKRDCVTDVGNDDGNAEKTVPPLRLKKIQSLRDWNTLRDVGRLKNCESTIEDSGLDVDSGVYGFAERENSEPNEKYRIVTGNTPPCDDPVNSSCERLLKSFEDVKLRYRRDKLKCKLRELRRKTVELGNEIMRTVVTTTTDSRESRLRRTIERYEERIKNLENTIDDPSNRERSDDTTIDDWKIGDSVDDDPSTFDRRDATIFSPIGKVRGSDESSVCSSPSLEPPKLSPRSPNDCESARSPRQLRDSPPILPRVYVTIADCADPGWNDLYSRRGRGKRKNRTIVGEIGKSEESMIVESSSSSTSSSSTSSLPVITTTVDAIVDEKIGIAIIDDESTKKNYSTIIKNDDEIVEVYELPEIREDDIVEDAKICGIPPIDEKSFVKVATSPRTIAIDDTVSHDDYDVKPQFFGKIDDIEKTEITMESQSITSSCEIVEDNDRSIDKKQDRKDEIVTVRENVVDDTRIDDDARGIAIDEQFPSLGNWIARLSNEQSSKVDNNDKIVMSEQIEERSSAFQVFNSEVDKPASPEVTRVETTRPVVDATPNVASQWRPERWQEQQDQQPPTLPQNYVPTVSLAHPPPSPNIGQEFCSPIAMARLYARNYAIDPYSMAYGYNPAIAAAAATASLWNSAAILQYPLMRPTTAILNAQSSRIPSTTLQFAPTSMSIQRSNCRLPMMQSNDVKRSDDPTTNYSRDPKTVTTPYSTMFEQTKRSNVDCHNGTSGSLQNRGNLGNNVSGRNGNYRNCLRQQHQHNRHGQQQQHQQQQQQHQQQHQQQQQTQEHHRQSVNSGYSANSTRIPVSGSSSWRNGHVLGPMTNDYNYTNDSTWNTTNSGIILNSMGRNSTNDYVGSSTFTVNSSRDRIVKDTNLRNCETPHLGKVNYSPNTISNLECSNCGLAGSMFKCLGCEVAFYCNENCQARHWNRHVISCPKKMPKLKKLVH